jgi:hypothetical protein
MKESKNSPIQKEDLITEEEMTHILEKNPNSMHRCIFALLWEGLRVGELGTLKCRNITFEGKEVFISVKGKTGERTVLSISGAPYIRTWLDQHPTQQPHDPLFVIQSNYNQGGPLGYTSIRRIVKKGCKKAGIQNKRIHPHVFRHSAITDRRRKGMRQREATAFFGVSSEVMSHVYDHLADSDVYDEVRRIQGIEKAVEKPLTKLKPKHCSICQKMNPHHSTICLNCGNPLSTTDAVRHQDHLSTLQQENQLIKTELNALRGLMEQFNGVMKNLSPQQKVQILQQAQQPGGE